jgi:cation diffusion facilitator family transporter
MKPIDPERRALAASIYGALFMACIGVYFAIVAESDAIMLDGIFSGLGFVMASLTLKVAGLVNRPDDEHFNYGYAHFAPLLNVVKSMLMLVLCTAALLSAVSALFHGGRSMAVGSAVIYGVIATAGCIVITLYIKRAAKSTGSALVEVDAESWVIDTVMSAAVLAAFILGWLLKDGAMGVYLDYLDPAVVTVLCLLALPIPLKILIGNAREVLLIAPDPALTQAVEERFKRALPEIQPAEYRIRLLKMGNTLNVLMHVKPGPDFSLNELSQLDEMRIRFNAALEDMEVNALADIVFINDIKMAG